MLPLEWTRVWSLVRDSVTIDAADLKDGDYAGLSAFQGDYAFAGITKENGKYYAVMLSNTSKGGPWDLSEEEGLVEAKELIGNDKITVRIVCDFTEDTATCFVETEDGSIQLGSPHKLRFRLDHFTGCRFALSCFSTISVGGTAVFKEFKSLV